MFDSKVRPLVALSCVVALSIPSTPNVARADEADDLSRVIISHINQRLSNPALEKQSPEERRATDVVRATAMRPSQEKRVTDLARAILKMFYYPVNLSDLQNAAIMAIDSADRSATASLEVAAVTAVVGALGHRARVYPLQGGKAEDPLPLPAALQVGSIRVVSLRALYFPGPRTSDRLCPDFSGMVPQNDGITGVVLDLRGDVGGVLGDVPCLASVFLEPGRPLFEVVDKQGGIIRSFQSKLYQDAPVALPVTVFIDKKTDSGAVLLAAILHDQGRATVIGERNTELDGDVEELLNSRANNMEVVLAAGEIFLPGKRRLDDAVTVDVSIPSENEEALMAAARARFAALSRGKGKP